MTLYVSVNILEILLRWLQRYYIKENEKETIDCINEKNDIDEQQITNLNNTNGNCENKLMILKLFLCYDRTNY